MSTSIPKPIPLAAGCPPPFPTHVLPAWLGDFVTAVATQTQTPPDLAGMLGLVVPAACLAKKIEVQAYDGWIEPVNLFVVVALPPASRKSSVFRHMTAPLAAWEREALASFGPTKAQTMGRRKILEGRLTLAQQAAAKAEPADQAAMMAEAERLAEELAELVDPISPRLLADDCTPEQVASLMAAHGGRLAVLSAEGGLFDTIAGRYSSSVPNFDVFLKGHAGDPVRVDRVVREGEQIAKPALTLGLTVQPAVVAGLANKPGFRERGLLGRFLYALPENTVGTREVCPPPVPSDTRQVYEAAIHALLNLSVPTDGLGEPQPQRLTCSPEALAALIAFETALEPRLGEGGDLSSISDWAGKLTGVVVRLAGMLHVAGLIQASGSPETGDPGVALTPWRDPISLTTVQAAITLADYLLGHARLAFGLMGADPAIEDAQHVLRWCKRQGVQSFTKRDIFNGCRSGRFARVASLDPALALLVDHHWLIDVSPPPTGAPGRRPSPVFELNAA